MGRGADPEKIRIQVQGADSLHVNDKGELEIKTLERSGKMLGASLNGWKRTVESYIGVLLGKVILT